MTAFNKWLRPFLIFFPFFATTISPNLKDLRLVYILFRHGDRSPIHIFPGDEQDNKITWPNGLGQLTQIGVEQQYFLGVWLRNRYKTFPLNYNKSFLHMRSTDIDRTLMSALANLAGFYEHSNSSLKKHGINWAPVPIHTVLKKTDALLALAPCPKYNEIVTKSYSSVEILNFIERHNSLFTLLKNVTGIKNFKYRDIMTVADDLICLESHKLNLPSWCTLQIKDEIIEVKQYFWRLQFDSSEKQRLSAGVYLKVATDEIKSFINPKLVSPISTTEHLSKHTGPHIKAFSAHDFNVAAILSALGVYDNAIGPAYASCVILELLGPNPPASLSDYRLRILYKRGWTDSQGEYLQFEACSHDPADHGCDFEMVLHQLEPVLLSSDEYFLECRLSGIHILRLITSFSIFIILLIIISFLISRYRMRLFNGYVYLPK